MENNIKVIEDLNEEYTKIVEETCEEVYFTNSTNTNNRINRNSKLSDTSFYSNDEAVPNLLFNTVTKEFYILPYKDYFLKGILVNNKFKIDEILSLDVAYKELYDTLADLVHVRLSGYLDPEIVEGNIDYQCNPMRVLKLQLTASASRDWNVMIKSAFLSLSTIAEMFSLDTLPEKNCRLKLNTTLQFLNDDTSQDKLVADLIVKLKYNYEVYYHDIVKENTWLGDVDTGTATFLLYKDKTISNGIINLTNTLNWEKFILDNSKEVPSYIKNGIVDKSEYPETKTYWNTQRIKELEILLIKHFTKENISINISEEYNALECVLKFDGIDISNTEGDEYFIKDLFVLLEFDLKYGYLNRLLGGKGKIYYSDIIGFQRNCCDAMNCEGCESDSDDDDDWNNDIDDVIIYAHSHLPSGYNFNAFCLGATSFAEFINNLGNKRYDWEDYKLNLSLLCFNIKDYLQHESLDGGPYNFIHDLNSLGNSNDPIIPPRNSPYVYQQYLTKFLDLLDIPVEIDANGKIVINKVLLEYKLDELKTEIPVNLGALKTAQGTKRYLFKQSHQDSELIEFMDNLLYNSNIIFKGDTISREFVRKDTNQGLSDLDNPNRVIHPIALNEIYDLLTEKLNEKEFKKTIQTQILC